MTEPGFLDLVNLMKPEDDGLTGHVPESWRQGRTAYGGATTGLAFAAVQKTFSDLPPLRSFQTAFIGPVGGAPFFVPKLLRQGRNVTSVGVDVHSDGKLAARLTFVFGGARDSALNQTLPAPEAPAPDACEDFTPEFARSFVPVFFLRFETKLIAGHRPMSGAEDGYIRAWSRHVDPASRDGMTAFVTLADVLPPAAIPTFKAFGPVSSVNWHMNILDPDAGTTDGWWHVETKLTAAQDGYSSQVMRFWNRDGRLVAEGSQNVAIFV